MNTKPPSRKTKTSPSPAERKAPPLSRTSKKPVAAASPKSPCKKPYQDHPACRYHCNAGSHRSAPGQQASATDFPAPYPARRHHLPDDDAHRLAGAYRAGAPSAASCARSSG